MAGDKGRHRPKRFPIIVICSSAMRHIRNCRNVLLLICFLVPLDAVLAEELRYFIYNTPPTVKVVQAGYDFLTLEISRFSKEGHYSYTSRTGYETTKPTVLLQYSENKNPKWTNHVLGLNADHKTRIQNLRAGTSYFTRIFGYYKDQDLEALSTLEEQNIGAQGPFTTYCSDPEFTNITAHLNEVDFIYNADEYSCNVKEYTFKIGSEQGVQEIIVNNDIPSMITLTNLHSSTEYTFYACVCTDTCSVVIPFVTLGNENPLTDGITFDHRQDPNTNLLHLQWNIPNISSFKQTSEFEICEKHFSKACMSPRILENRTRLDYNQIDYNLPVVFYSRYLIDFVIIGDVQVTKRIFSWNYTTSYADNIDRNEISSPIRKRSTTTSVTLIFDEWDCTKLRGPVFINYTIVANNSACCAVFSIESITIPLPIETKILTITGLQPSCEYIVHLQYNRRRDHRDPSQFDETSIQTLDSDSIANEEIPSVDSFTSNVFSIIISMRPAKKCRKGSLYLKCIISNGDKNNHWCTVEDSQKSREFPFDSPNIVISSLTPFCNYSIQICVVRGSRKKMINEFYQQTKPTVIAGKVRDLTVISQGLDHIELRWLPPESVTGKLQGYGIEVRGKNDIEGPILTTEGKEQCKPYYCYTISDKLTNQSYKISVVAYNTPNGADLMKEIRNALHKGDIPSVMAETKGSIPEPPNNIRITWINESLLNISWNQPNATYGRVTSFLVTCTLFYQRTSKTLFFKQNVSTYHRQYSQLVNLTQENRHYRQKMVKAKLCIITQNSHFSSPCHNTRIPPPQPKEYQKQAYFLNGQVVMPKLTDIADFLSIIYVYLSEERLQNTTLDEFTAGIINDTVNKSVFYDFTEIDKDMLIDIDNTKLNLTTQLHVAIFIVNELNQLRNVSVCVQSVDVTPNSSITTVIVIILIILALILFGLVFFKYRRNIFISAIRFKEGTVKYANDVIPLNSAASSDDVNDFIFEDYKQLHSKRIPVDKLRDYVKSAIDNGELDRQHQLFPKPDMVTARLTCTYGSLPQNKLKNRYNNIVPYDRTRVRLSKLAENEFSDYINANYIDGYKMPKAYIATQGPTPDTLQDFWRMIWEKHVSHIVMLTNLYDGKKKACEQYWPHKDGYLTFNEIRIELIDVIAHPTYDERRFSVTSRGTKRTISQIHFKVWPPRGQLLFAHTLISLLQRMMAIPYNPKSPILVHCSAGVGRTGTIILCDICLRMVGAENVVDFLLILKKLREQRPNMVDNASQYKLAHLSVIAVLTARSTMIPCNGNLKPAIEKILDAHQVRTVMQRIKEDEWQDDVMKVNPMVLENVPVSRSKNRHPDILPEKFCQVVLQQLPGQGTMSQYINAIWVDSFQLTRKYIVTQHPLHNTLVDFWRMIFQELCGVVINLNPIDEKNTNVRFWPKNYAPISLGSNTQIQLLKSSNESGFSMHTVKAKNKPNEAEQTNLTVQVLNYDGWDVNEQTPRSIEHFLTFIINATCIIRASGPIIITCRNGATASGLFIALSNLMEQMQDEKVCDIYKIVRCLRVHRKQFINQEEQLEVLYRGAIIYANDLGLYKEPYK